ncbi:MAG TPA: hypothetical protein PKA28_00205 [Methylomusa anaerophila]|uniref:Type 4 fimbrial biogenesis protein PilX N-terminal domain-containing protein n=1 Tax=Methylomusa anaerophila TaxID=1930071 RepID=A0A348AQG9_9FIRM|nr:hypothetical protein [Methylomusa anaerophila]BBB93317.1 hypothetical protein MAMMFC1_04029 [Methylomusa anaerophila]HML86852.1 hypothetical protein [Methylomusa anaerophila]
MNISRLVNIQSGSAALLAVITMALLLTIGAGFFTITRTEFTAAVNYGDGITAQYAAEAGANRAIISLAQNQTNWTWLKTDIAVSGASAAVYNIEINSTGVEPELTYGSSPVAGGTYQIIAKGKYHNTLRIVNVMVKVGAAGMNTEAYNWNWK